MELDLPATVSRLLISRLGPDSCRAGLKSTTKQREPVDPCSTANLIKSVAPGQSQQLYNPLSRM